MRQANLQSALMEPANAVWEVLGNQMSCRVKSEETGGAYSIVESTVPPQDGAPPHVHTDEDEMFYVLEGEFEIRCGDRSFTARKGSTAMLPRGIPHAFRNVGTRDGKLLVTITPGGFENFFAEVSREVTTMPPDLEKLKRLGQKYKLEFFV
jgi:mannose-6-phosphate isomerase-like protein (cupin superfamily)